MPRGLFRQSQTAFLFFRLLLAFCGVIKGNNIYFVIIIILCYFRISKYLPRRISATVCFQLRCHCNGIDARIIGIFVVGIFVVSSSSLFHLIRILFSDIVNRI